MEKHGSVIGHLLSQVRIGMDLTKVVLPTFILERRSLLEMYADFFAHPDFFCKSVSGWLFIAVCYFVLDVSAARYLCWGGGGGMCMQLCVCVCVCACTHLYAICVSDTYTQIYMTACKQKNVLLFV